MSSVVVKSIDKDLVRRRMDEYAARLLASRPDVEEIVVFGSFEKDNYAPGSDLDLFILLTGSDLQVRDRVPELLPGPFPVPVDVFPYTPAEVAAIGSSPVIDAVRASTWRYRRS